MYNAVQHPYNKEIQGVDIKKATIKSLFELLCIFNCRTPDNTPLFVGTIAALAAAAGFVAFLIIKKKNKKDDAEAA